MSNSIRIGVVVMNARNAMTEYRLSSWVKMVQDRDCSGLSIKEYCEGIEIAPRVYYYRLKKADVCTLLYSI